MTQRDETDTAKAWIEISGPATVITPAGLTYEIAADITIKVPMGSAVSGLDEVEWEDRLHGE